MRKNEIIDWQRRFRARPLVWTVLVRNEETGNLYDSREAAEIEVQYWKGRGCKSARVSCLGNIHDEALSRERWRPPPKEESRG